MKRAEGKGYTYLGACITAMLAVSLSACSDIQMPDYSCFRSVEASGWHKLKPAVFTPDSVLCTGNIPVNASLSVRYTSRLNSDKLPLLIERSDSMGVIANDTVIIALDRKIATFGIYEIDTLVYKELKPASGYQFAVYHLTDTVCLPGVVNIGMTLNRLKNNSD